MSNVSLIDGHIDGIKKYDLIRNMNVEEMAELFAVFVWEKICECDQTQQTMCEHYGMPDGGCIQCITNDIEEWLESEVTE